MLGLALAWPAVAGEGAGEGGATPQAGPIRWGDTAMLAEADAASRGALAAFDGSVLSALREVETALSTYVRGRVDSVSAGADGLYLDIQGLGTAPVGHVLRVG